jgi:hypothetical protein
VSVTVITFLLLGIFLILFGLGFAVSDERAPLRIAAIGVVLIYLGIASLIASAIFALV